MPLGVESGSISRRRPKSFTLPANGHARRLRQPRHPRHPRRRRRRRRRRRPCHCIPPGIARVACTVAVKSRRHSPPALFSVASRVAGDGAALPRCGRIASLPPCCRLTVAAVLVMVIINSGHEEQVPVVSRNAFVFTSGVVHSTSLARYRAYTSTRFPRQFPVLVLVFEATAVKFSPRRLPRPQDLPISNTFASQHFISIDNDRRMNIEMQKNTPSLMARPLRTYVDNFRP